MNKEDKVKKALEEMKKYTTQKSAEKESKVSEALKNMQNSVNNYNNTLSEIKRLQSAANYPSYNGQVIALQNKAREGLKESRYGKGNIDLTNRPLVKNDDGSVSTIRSISFSDGKNEILIPTVVNGRVVSDQEAIDHYYNTGEYLGKFKTIEEADNYAQKLHEQQEKLYSSNSRLNETPTNWKDLSLQEKTNWLLTKQNQNSLKQGTNLADSANIITSTIGRQLGQTPTNQGSLLQVPENMKDNNRRFEDGYQFGDIIKTLGENFVDSASAIGSTLAEIPTRITKGVLSVPENIANAGASLIAGGADLIGHGINSNQLIDFSSRLRKQVAAGSPFKPIDDALDKINESLNKSSLSGGLLDSATEGIGQTFGQMAVSSFLGQQLGVGTKMGEIPIKVGKFSMDIPITALVTGLGSSATETYSKAEQQLNGIENATWREKVQMALNIAAGGTVEGTTEGLFGLMGMGRSTIGDAIKDKLMSKAVTSMDKVVMSILISGGGEAIEEAISYFGNWLWNNGFVNNIGQLNFEQVWNNEDVWQEMLSAFLSSSISQGSTNINQINRLTNNAIQEAEYKQRRNLTASEKASIKEQMTSLVTDAKESLQNSAIMYPQSQRMLDLQNVKQNVQNNNEYLRQKYNIEPTGNLTTRQKLALKYNLPNANVQTSTSQNMVQNNVQQQTIQPQNKNQNLVPNNSSIQGLEDYTEQDIKDFVMDHIQEKLGDVNIKGIALNGSRLRGDSRNDSDLDVVVEYDGDMTEDGFFNAVNEDPLVIDGIKVDINPITASKSGTLQEYMERSRQYDNQKLTNQPSSDTRLFKAILEQLDSQEIYAEEQKLMTEKYGDEALDMDWGDEIDADIENKATEIVYNRFVNSDKGKQFIRNYNIDEKSVVFEDNGNSSVMYHVTNTLSDDIDNIISNINERNPVKLRDFTPKILVQNGVKDLPMYENPSHIRKNILTEAEAKKLGIQINQKDNYHGLGKDTYIKAIDSLDNPRAIFKYNNKNQKGNDVFLVLTIVKDSKGNNIIVPIEIETDTVTGGNRIDINRVETVYGYEKRNGIDLNDYIKHNINSNIFTKIYEQKKERGTGFSTAASSLKKRSTDNIPNSTSNNIIPPTENYVNSNNETEKKIRTSLTVQEVKDLLKRTFINNKIESWYDGKYKNADEWLKGEGADEVEMYAENTESVVEKYVNRLYNMDNGFNDEYYLSDIFNAYLNNELVDENKKEDWHTIYSTSQERVDTSKDTGYKGKKFYEPKEIKLTKELYNTASKRVTNSNREAVYKARADFIIAYHQNENVEDIGLSTEEVNKKIKSWANYPNKALKLSQDLNENVSRQNQWTGLENSSIVNTVSISNKEMGELVKDITGDSNGWQRKYITSTMLALDTHIDYSPLTFKFDEKQELRKGHANGDYNQSTDVIRIGDAYQNTVAHEIGHFIDHHWCKEILGKKAVPLSSAVKTNYDKSKLTENQIKFLDHFYQFQNSIELTAEMGDTLDYKSTMNNEYWQRPTEVFARFIGKFTEWVRNMATNNRYGYEEKFYHDRFTESQYKEFVKILQEKSALDTNGEISIENTDTNASTETLKEALPIESKEERAERVRKYIEETQKSIGTLGAKVSRKDIVNRIIDNYGITTRGNSKELNKVSKEIQDLILNGGLTDGKIEGYAEQLIDNLKVTIDDYYNANKELKELIRRTKLYVSDEVKAGFGDFNDFKKQNIGNIRMTNDREAMPVDSFYQELSEIYGETFFPSNIANASDQLEKIAEVTSQIKKIDKTLRENIEENFGEEAREEIVNGLIENFKTLREKASEPVKEETEIPQIKERSWTKTARKNEMVDTFLKFDDLKYVVRSNKATAQQANERLETKGYEDSLKHFEAVVESGKFPSVDDIALGERLIQEAIKRGDFEKATEIIADVTILGTELGQSVQAMSMIRRLSPAGQLMYLERALKRINEKEQSKRKPRKKKTGLEKVIDEGKVGDTEIKIPDNLKNEILSAQTPEDLQKAVDRAKEYIASQLPVTMTEKLTEWRYLMMLGNPKTHVRNTVGNLVMQVPYEIKNFNQRVLETLFDSQLEERTATFKKATKTVKDFADAMIEENRDALAGTGYTNIQSELRSMRKIYKSKVVNALNQLNTNALELEDFAFKKRTFRNVLAEYLTANEIKTEADIKAKPELVQKAINYAIEEAKKATFNQYNAVATAISRFENSSSLGKVLIGGLAPFKRTPLNIVKTAWQYSPAGLAGTLTKQTWNLRNGLITPNDYIERISQGLTGTGIALMGMLLASLGLIKGSLGSKKKDKYEQGLGLETPYSFQIGNKSIDISWLSPSAVPLLMGVEIHSALQDGEWLTMDDAIKVLEKTMNPVSKMTMLSTIDDALINYGGDDDVSGLAGIIDTVTKSYISQAFPTLGGQINRIVDPTIRSTAVSKNSKFKTGETILRQNVNKVAGLSYMLEPSLDVWGNPRKRDDNIILRSVDALVNPANITKDTSTEVDHEILRIYDANGNDEVIPTTPQKYFTANSEKYEMSAAEYTEYRVVYGQTSYENLEKLFSSSEYKKMTDIEKEIAIKRIYDDAKQRAKLDFLTNRYGEEEGIKRLLGEKDINKVTRAKEIVGIDYNAYLKGYYAQTGVEGEKDKNGKTINGSVKKNKIEAIKKALPKLTNKQAEDLYKIYNGSL